MGIHSLERESLGCTKTEFRQGELQRQVCHWSFGVETLCNRFEGHLSYVSAEANSWRLSLNLGIVDADDDSVRRGSGKVTHEVFSI